MPTKETLEFIGKVVAVAALLFTAFSYVNNLRLGQEKARYDEARALIAQYRSEGIRDAEQLFFTRSLYYRIEGMDPNDPADYPESIYKEIANEMLFGATGSSEEESPSLLHDLLDIADFYSEVSFCLAQGICDAEIAEMYFCPRAETFRTANRRLISFYSDYANSQEWGNGILALVERCAD